ncbi:tetratricopeptide repeat protein [Pyxidicoccus parkwayensis]|uniref:Tetratricopeptide repeat protein n=1 Tax=Pyxidicoccus parkwayensis TaxID=2813578 RepID=A0ABX7P2W7_9BACT|nr:tetratricopeptide repeat protein [Pyxidicoccus parkwaysis]QSQ24796.1 tetratricopeptide repeat protein [Pyxidicoccus parkwaysis]
MGCIDESLFMKLLLGELSPEQRTEVDTHLDTCAACRQLVAQGLRAQSPDEPGSDRELLSPADPGGRPRETRLEKGTAVGRYLVLSLLGEGGMGVVYRAYDPELDRRVALKLLRVGALGLEAERGRAHLLREAQAMARVSHPNVVPVYDVGTFGPHVFLAMELVDAQTLGEWLKSSPRPPRQVLSLFLDAGRGLAAAHAAGVVHGDFKPENLLVGSDGRVHVTDFGLAHLGTTPGGGRPLLPGALPSLSADLTMRSAVGGTPAYMPPEQLCDGATSSPSGDQFAFCVTLHEALYGVRPFEGTSLATLSAEVRAGRVRLPPAGTHVPPWLRRVLLRGLSVRPDERFPSMEALLAALQRDPAVRWRRGLAVAGGVALLATAVALTHQLTAHHARACDGAAELSPLWNAERQGAIEAAFLATGRPYASGAWQRVRRELDAYTAAWATTRTAACEATRVRGEQSEEVLAWRMRCLDSRLADVSALTRLLSQADSSMVDEAHRAVKSLAPLSSCSEALAPGGDSTPEDASTRERRSALRETLAQARALETTGRYKDGVALLEPVAKAARDAKDRREGAEAFLLLGELKEGAGDWKGAEAALFEAVDAAEATRQDAVAARAWTLLVRVSTVGLDAFELASRWRHRAAAAIDRLGSGNELLRANLLTYAGTLLVKQARYDEAVASQEEALALVERAFGADGLEAADVHQELGDTRREQGRPTEARAHLERAVALTRQALGPEHPEVARMQLALVPVLRMQGEHAAAEALARGALESMERTLGPEHPRVYDALNDLATSIQVQGRQGEALPLYERALAIATKTDGPDSLGVAVILGNMGWALHNSGMPEEARARFQQALAIKEKLLGPQSPGLAPMIRAIGGTYARQKRPVEALPWFERAASLQLAQKDDANSEWATALIDLGSGYYRAGRPADAIAPLEQVLAGKEGAVVLPDHRALTHLLLARARWDAGRDRGRAVKLALEARRLSTELGASARDILAATNKWLAEHERGVH